MASSLISALLKRQDNSPFLSVDIGTSAIKVMTMDVTAEKPKVIALCRTPTPAGGVSNNAVSKPKEIAQCLRSLLEANEIRENRVTVAIPGPAVFTKRITIGYCEPKELENNIRFEASNYIPHSVDAVHLDYQVLKVHGTSSMEVLLVAVKNDIVLSYAAAIEEAGLIPAIADVDYFALENMFETNYPEEKAKTIALINIGARYSSVSILENGESLFSGDVGVGGRLYTDALVEALGISPADAEQAKMGQTVDGIDVSLLNETMDRTTEHIASELHRQIGFFWNAASTEKSIENIYVTGGAAQASGLLEELSAKSGLVCNMIETFRHIDWSENLDPALVDDLKSSMGVSVGLAMRRFGDKQHAVQG